MTTQHFISPTRLARLFAWAMLWLVKYAVFLVQDGPQARRRLQKMASAIRMLIILRAAAMVERPRRRLRAAAPPSAPLGFSRRRVKPGMRMVRAAAGSRLWRRLRARGAGARFSALINALLNADALAREIAKRLQRRLTRLCPTLPVSPPAAAAISVAFAAPAHGVDTS